jgi:hypothetical protein
MAADKNRASQAPSPLNYQDAMGYYQNRVSQMRAGFPNDYSAAPPAQFMDWNQGRQQMLANQAMGQRLAQQAQGNAQMGQAGLAQNGQR